MEVPMSRLCNKFRLNNPLSHHQQIHSNTFLLQGAKPSANTALVVAYTGLDLSDAVNLKWRNVDFRNQVIRVYRNKTLQNPESREISIPITDRVMDVLRFHGILGFAMSCYDKPESLGF
jgi:integrase